MRPWYQARCVRIYAFAIRDAGSGTFAGVTAYRTLSEAPKYRTDLGTDPSVGRSRVREYGTSGHAAAH